MTYIFIYFFSAADELYLFSSVLNISEVVQIDKETSILSPTNLCSENLKVLFVIPSYITNYDERVAIRHTWGLWIQSNASTRNRYPILKENFAWNDMKLVFLIGKSDNMQREANELVMKEHLNYDDIIVEDFIDSYLNLTLKSIFMLKWVNMHCTNVKYIIKADDDMFINIPNLRKALNVHGLPNRLLLGHLICGARPITDKRSKWYAPPYMFKGKYPNYLSGTSYLISNSIVKPLLIAAVRNHYFHLEDVFITGVCAKQIGVKPIGVMAFHYHSIPLKPCWFKKVISAHELNSLTMKKMWSELQGVNCSSFTPKLSYFKSKC